MNLKHALLTAGLLASAAAVHAQVVVGVSWSNFQEERWKTDEAAIKAELAKRGATYVSADAGGSPEKQLADVDGLIAKGAKALVILAMDKDAIVPALAKAKQRNIPVVAYDRLIDQPGVFYITFDNQEVGRMQARAVFSVKPTGNYVMIKGSPTDPNADFLRAGQQEVLAPAIKSGAIKIVGEEYTEGWKPEVAQKNMEQILTRNNNKVDAVVASNDGTPAAWWRRCRRAASRACRCRARTATRRRSTAWRWARRRCRSGRTRATSDARPPTRRSTSPAASRCPARRSGRAASTR